jgi:DNA repair protein RadC
MSKVVNFQVVKIKLVKEEIVQYGAKKSIRSPQDAFGIVQHYLADADREHLIVLVLNTKNQIMAINTAHIGSLSSSIVHPREVFKPAILANGASIIVAHNHPSGNLTPSSEDITITKRLIEAGNALGIDVLDHIIVGETCLSLKESGYM